MNHTRETNLPERIEEYFNDWYVQFLNNMKSNIIKVAIPRYFFMGDEIKFHSYSDKIDELLKEIDKNLLEHQQSKYPDLFGKV